MQIPNIKNQKCGIAVGDALENNPRSGSSILHFEL
jgi:hypothetical protein